MEEIVEEESRISYLLDCLIIEILSRLPYTKQAITTSVLSKRWQHLWTFAHTLIFNECFDTDIDIDTSKRKGSLSDYFSFIDKSLTQCQSKLHKLKISNYKEYGIRFASPHVNNWIRCAINRKVQQLSLVLEFICGKRFVLEHELFFNNSCFTHLKLGHCEFNPTGTISWKNLTRLSLLDAILDEDLVQNILSGSPLLETLKLEDCEGFRRLDITSKSVKNLFFSRYFEFDNMEINAPYVLSLTISMRYLRFLVRLLLLDVSSLVKVELRCFLTNNPNDEGEDDMLKKFILKCSHVREFNIEDKFSKVLSRLKAKGFIFPSNLKVLDVTSPLYSGSDSTDIDDSSDDDSSGSDSSGGESVESIDSEKLMPGNYSEADEVN